MREEKVKIGGVITQFKQITTRKDNKKMAFVTLEDNTGEIEIIVFPRIFAREKRKLGTDRVVVITGRVNERDRRLSVIAEKITSLDR